MNDSDTAQAALWNGPAGQAWVDGQEMLDQLFKPFEDLLVAAVPRSARRVLDIGCGTGSTTLAVARELGSCTGLDISAPMINAARARAERDGAAATFIVGNAEIFAFEPETYDAIISRFGVMFFEDSVRAFGNLRRATTAEAELCVITWRSAQENPFMTTAERAAGQLLPNLPVRKPGAPGQFALSDKTHVQDMLVESGWTDVDVVPLDVACTLPERDLVRYVTRLGPLGLALREADEELRNRAIATARAAFEPYVSGAEVHFTAACWMVSARSTARS